MSSTSPLPTSARPSQTTTTTSGNSSNSRSTRPSQTSAVGPVLTTTSNPPVNDVPVATMSTVVTSIPASSASGPQPSSRTGSPVGLIVGLVLGLIVLMALILFLVRRHFIKKRTQKTTSARARMSRPGGGNLVISGPTNFKHVGSGAMNPEGNGNPATNDRSINLAANLEAAIADTEVEGEVEGSQDDHRKEGLVWHEEDRPSNRFRQKYPPNINAVESGLYDHLEVVKSKHVPVRRI